MRDKQIELQQDTILMYQSWINSVKTIRQFNPDVQEEALAVEKTLARLEKELKTMVEMPDKRLTPIIRR